ncbi:barnase inhibitor [Bacillus pumilus]|uniref:Barnase inhibitor n=1 Tax=Bacillus pumilus TaxID=1408 RepID=A0A2A5IXG8_BACPU|nr:barstar family protein [Bacillus pumilus]PCK22025.1 barnase inhibitor [Bacillus pumilus]
MNKVQLDGAACRSQEELHNQLQTILHLPDHYGKNLDALWDCLTGELSLPLELTWVDFQTSKNDLGEYAESLQQLFQEAEEELKGQFRLNLQ